MPDRVTSALFAASSAARVLDRVTGPCRSRQTVLHSAFLFEHNLDCVFVCVLERNFDCFFVLFFFGKSTAAGETGAIEGEEMEGDGVKNLG